jgi:hypothetical protein
MRNETLVYLANDLCTYWALSCMLKRFGRLPYRVRDLLDDP